MRGREEELQQSKLGLVGWPREKSKSETGK